MSEIDMKIYRSSKVSYIFVALLVHLMSGCVSVPNKGLSSITEHLVKDQTGLTLNPNLYHGKPSLPPGL